MNIKRAFLFLLFLAMQILVFNHVQVFGYGIPMICIYPILRIPLGTPRWVILLASFITGLVADIFSNTPGMYAATLTLVGMMQPGLLKIFTSRDQDDENARIEPSARILGWGTFCRYIMLAVLVQEIVFYTLEAFSFFNYIKYGINIGSGWLMTSLVLMAFESVRTGAEKGKRE